MLIGEMQKYLIFSLLQCVNYIKVEKAQKSILVDNEC